MTTESLTETDISNLYPVDPKQEWPRGTEEVAKGLNLIMSALQHLNQLEKEIPVRATYSPEALSELIDLDFPKGPTHLSSVIERLHEVAKLTPTTSSRSFFNQLFAGRDPAALAGELFAAFGNQSVYTYKVAAPIVLIEDALIQRLGRIAGLSNEGQRCGGIFTPGGSLSNLAAMLCARDLANPNWREEGLLSGRIYTSAESHYSVSKGAGIIGIGRKNVVKVSCDEHGRMDCISLRQAIEDDMANGLKPIMVIATAGTTVRGSFDPFAQIAEICKSFGLWFHVDGAFGGTALFHSCFAEQVKGISLADSLTWDAHKAMGTPLTCSVLLTKDPQACELALNESASYLFQADSNLLNPGTRSLQCGRRNDALKLWAAWLYHGDEGWIRRLERQRNLALALAEEVKRRPMFDLCEAPPYLNVCFEIKQVDQHPRIDHEALCYQLQVQQDALVGYATFKGRTVIRAAVINPALTHSDINHLLNSIENIVNHLQ